MIENFTYVSQISAYYSIMQTESTLNITAQEPPLHYKRKALTLLIIRCMMVLGMRSRMHLLTMAM